MKIVPDHVYPRGTRDIFVASLSNHSVSCGSVVPCVETSRLKPTTANELYGSQWTSGRIRISKKDLDKLKGQNRRNWSSKRGKKASTNKMKKIHDIIFSNISRFATQTFDGGWYCGVVTKIGFITVLTSRQPREKLQCLYENLMSKNFRKTAVLKKIWIVN